MPVVTIQDLNDPRLDVYRSIRTRNLTRWSGRFIAEGKPLVERLLGSDHQIESVLIDHRFLDEAEAWLPESITVLSVPHERIAELIGFQFHRGYLACGLRKQILDASELQPMLPSRSHWVGAMLIGIQDPENLGTIIRTSAGLGIRDVILGPGTADAYSRRVLRVSMGGVFRVSLFHCSDAVGFLHQAKLCGITTWATSLQNPSRRLMDCRVTGPTIAIFGNEAYGLPAEVQSVASERVNIPMAPGTDSLNVAVTAGIVLHYLSTAADWPASTQRGEDP